MDLPAIVRSAHTWDTSGPDDLRQGEEAIVVSAVEEYCDEMNVTSSTWTLIPLERPRLVRIVSNASVQTTLKRWLKPA